MKPTIGFDRFLNIRSAYSPIWLTSDTKIAFLSDITGTPQVWAVDSEGGWPDQLTFFQDKVWTLDPSPGGDRFICSRDTGGNERYQLYMGFQNGSDLHRLTTDDEAIHHFGGWSPNGEWIAYTSNSRNGTHFDVYIQKVGNGDTAERIYETDGNFRVLGWSPDALQLLVQNSVSSAHQPVALLTLSDKRLQPFTSDQEPVDSEPVCWSPDGNVYLITNRNRDYMNLARMDVSSGEITYLAEHPRDLESLAVSSDGKGLAYTINEDGYSKLQLFDLSTGTSRPVTDLPDGVVAEPAFSRSGGHVAVSVQTPGRNLDIWTVDTRNLHCRQVTRSSCAGISRKAFADPKLVHFETFDHRDIPAFYYRPPQVSPPFPVILYVHGGPASQVRPDFDPRFQYFLNRGYAILAPNVRGSSGYGKTYMALDDVRNRMDSMADLNYAVKWLKNSGEVDPDRIAIYGRSYGGYMVLAAVTTYPKLWAAAIDVVGIVNWVTFLETTSSWRRAHREQEYGSLEQDRDFLNSISPIHKLDRISAPMLVIHGANDPRVPISEADQVVAHLRARHHPVEYLRYEDEGHKISKIGNRVDSFTKMAEFLDRFL